MTDDQATITLFKFLKSWQAGDAKTMLNHTQLTWRSRSKNPLGDLVALYESVDISTFKVIRASKITDFKVDILVEINNKSQATLCIIKEIAPYKTSKDGQWGVNPISALRLIR